MIQSSLRLSVRYWRCVGSLGIPSVGFRRQLADQAHRREVTMPTTRPNERASIRMSKDPVLDRRQQRQVVDRDLPKHQAENEKDSTDGAAAAETTVSAKLNTMKHKVSAEGLKRLMKEYGPVAVTFHASVFLATLGSCYSLIDYGLDVPSLVKNVPLIANNLPHPSAGNLALAWGLTTVTGPFRGIITVTLTPRVARLWWGREAKRKLKGLAKERRRESSS